MLRGCDLRRLRRLLDISKNWLGNRRRIGRFARLLPRCGWQRRTRVYGRVPTIRSLTGGSCSYRPIGDFIHSFEDDTRLATDFCVLGAAISILLWWIANGLNERFNDVRPESALGGNTLGSLPESEDKSWKK